MPVKENVRKGCGARVDALQGAAEDDGPTADAAAVGAAIATVAAGVAAVGIKQTDCKRRGMARVFCFFGLDRAQRPSPANGMARF